MSLSALENKAVLYLISKIRPEDNPGKTYTFNCREFQALLNWNREASYQNVKIMIQNLGDLSWWIEGEVNGKKKDILVRWFDIVHMDPGTGDIDISFHRDMFPFLIDLQKHLEEDGHYYTTYKLQNVTLMKHRYSPRIYELLKSYQYNNRKWTFENGTGTEHPTSLCRLLSVSICSISWHVAISSSHIAILYKTISFLPHLLLIKIIKVDILQIHVGVHRLCLLRERVAHYS
jgi:hypothetical protein